MLPPQHIEQPVVTSIAQGYNQKTLYERLRLPQVRASTDISTSQTISAATRPLQQQLPSAETPATQGLLLLPAQTPESQGPSQQSTHAFPLPQLQPSSIITSSLPTEIVNAIQQQLLAQLGMFLQPVSPGQQQQQGTQQITLQQILQQQQQQSCQHSQAVSVSQPQPYSQQRHINTLSLLPLQQANLLGQILQQQISMDQGNTNLRNSPIAAAAAATATTTSQQPLNPVAQSQLEALYAAFARGQQRPQRQPRQLPRKSPHGSPSSKQD